MIVLDASVMIAVLDARDAHSERAREILRTHVSERFMAHRFTLAETLVRAVRDGRSAQVASALADLGIERHDELDDPQQMAELRVRSGLKLPDCCVLATAIREGADLATFDARLAFAAASQGVVVVS